MARISFLMLQEAGHVLGTLKVAASLRSRGHEVCYLATSEFSEDVVSRGLQWHEVFPQTPQAVGAGDRVRGRGRYYRTKLEIWLQIAASLGVDVRQLSDVRALAVRKVLIPELVKSRPDVAVCDAYLTATYGDDLLRACSFPVVGLNTTIQFHEGNGLPEYVLCPAEFDVPDNRRASPYRQYCEPAVEWASGESGSFPWTWIDPRRKLVYCSLGTQCAMFQRAPSVLRSIVDGISRTGRCQLIVAAGQLEHHDALRHVPDNVLVAGYAPQLALLRRADLAVIHGGLGTVKECLMAKVPTLTVPFRFDQPLNAERLEFHGVGLRCWPEECTAEAVASACEQLLESQVMRERLSSLAEALWRCETEAPAVAAIDRLARSA